MCFHVDPMSGMGTCVEMCTGDESNPLCVDTDRACAFNHDAALALCLLSCDPLAPACPDGLYCGASLDRFVCLHEGSGGPGDACDHLVDCAAPLSCIQGATPGCADRCCTEACDPAMPACTEAEQSCLPLGIAGVCAVE